MNVLIIGLVSPTGSKRKSFFNKLKDILNLEYNFDVHHVDLSEFILAQSNDVKSSKLSKIDLIKKKIKVANDIRKQTDNEVFGYYAAMRAISIITDIQNNTPRKIIFIDQLKRAEEINILKNIFGKSYFTLGILGSEEERISQLTNDDTDQFESARDLILIDENEGDFLTSENNFVDIKVSEDAKKFGQQMSKCVLKCDALFDHNFDRENVMRFFDLLLGHPYIPPTKDEYFLNFAFVASLKGLDLSRQVGAVVINKYGEVVSTGYNEVNKFGGGPYEGVSNNDKNDYLLGYDPNKKVIEKMKQDIVSKLSTTLEINSDAILNLLNSSMVNDITEFHRATHAEMNALLSALRARSSVHHGTLYCTTYPCHNCCKHIISSGIKKVVYLEPYKKSHALKLHYHEITHDPDESDRKVYFKSFYGITHNRFKDLFSISYSSGRPIKRKDKESNQVIEFPRKSVDFRYQLDHKIIRKLGKIISDALTVGEKFDIEAYKKFCKIEAA